MKQEEKKDAELDVRESHGRQRVDPQAASRQTHFLEGFHDGIPIAMGYFVVSFTLGIAAKNAGLSAWEGFLASFFNNASAGEYAAFTLIAANASYVELIIMTFIANARYLLMSFAVGQKFSADTPLYQRLLVGFDITDEIFGITIARSGKIAPFYNYGAMMVALPGWSVGTALGIIAGNMLPQNIVSALSVALFGMFLWVIIPTARRNRVVFCLVSLSFLLSLAFASLPWLSSISSGTRTILLTVLISAAGAWFFPVSASEDTAEQIEISEQDREKERQ